MSGACSSSRCQDEAVHLDELWNDPTLQDCCRRDLLLQHKSAKLKEQLLQQDRTIERSRLMRQVVVQPPQTASSDSSGLESDADTDDEELQRLRSLRLAEMKVQAAQASSRQAAGLGTLQTLQPSALLGEVEQRGGYCVCHLLVPGYEPSQLLDEHLEVLAHRHQHTFFARVPLSRNSSLVSLLQLPEIPALVCFRSGTVVGRVGLTQFGAPHQLQEEQVDAYLTRLKMLHGTEDGASADACASEDDIEPGRYAPCEVCGRAYPHEHVRAVYSQVQDDSDEDSDF